MNIQEQFNAVARDYDQQRRLFIPCFDDFYGVAIENLLLTKGNPSLLDIGAGIGLFSEMVLKKYPQARIELIDLSSDMLQIAKERLASYPDVTFTIADMNDIQPENNKYDAIISSLAIHHLTDKDKKNLYQKIFCGLKPIGIFMHAEQVLAPNIHLQEVYHSTWLDKIKKSGLSMKEIEMGLERVKLDKRTPLETQLSWLKDIGFANVDCLFKYYDFVVIKAEKL